MKRILSKASYEISMPKPSSSPNYDTFQTISLGPSNRYSCYMSEDEDRGLIKFQISKLSAYDDAEYYWAKCDGNTVKYILDGKIKDKMILDSYDSTEEEWDEYCNRTFEDVLYDLVDLNKNISPRMMYN